MKRKIIAGLVLTLVFSYFSSIQALAIEKDSSSNQTVTQVNKAEEPLSMTETIKQQAQLLVNKYGTTSVQYAVIDSGKIVLSDNAGVYNKAENRSLTKDNMYGIGSMSKMFVAASVMKLVDEGKIDLDTPVVNYIPKFKMADERYKQITPRMLINHSSGLMGTTFNNTFLLNDNDTIGYDKLLSELSTQRLKADPGEFSVYCNDGFTLAQLLVEQVSCMDFTTYIHENFTKPLELSNTKTPRDTFDRTSISKAYNASDKKELPVENVNIIGTGGIYSTAEDLCQFTRIFTDTNNSILSKKSIEAMAQKEYEKGIYNKSEDNIQGYGLGWDSVNCFPFNRYGITALAKGGDTFAYHGNMITLPQYGLSVAVISSGGSSSYDQAFGTSILLQVLKEKGIISKILPDVTLPESKTAQMPKELTKYSGLYNAGNIMANSTVDPNGTLTLSIVGTSKSSDQVFTYTDDGYFTSADGDCKCKFVEEKNGVTYLERRAYITYDGLPQTVIWDYNLQKVDSNPLSDNLKAAWESRKNKDYYVLNEKYTSETYMKFFNARHITLNDEAPGYLMGHKIVNENEAKAITKIPGTIGRDLFDYNFYTENGVEYLKTGSNIAVSSDAVPALSKDLATVTIAQDGYAKWYTVSSEMADKTMKVELPINGAFAVYDANGSCVNYSYISGENSISLADGYHVVFMGDKGAVFNVSFK
ncbi:serine hydrolase domain-containing protein [Clostridium uliginosum]|uniref:CubicO group peptidase, beta-lactamase class C family n=1 Tax=Clostridium uliginosum TaxID=119641 RepID=A0A1I1QPV4_9CLOT|nr:serine hydrolase domain-containing protein [Clostridium uliginosum]SFD24134.1 CubicO group peptidase, beta-lactamase class C family [Clostridium uliginosum]